MYCVDKAVNEEAEMNKVIWGYEVPDSDEEMMDDDDFVALFLKCLGDVNEDFSKGMAR
jgi:hypothetical protein